MLEAHRHRWMRTCWRRLWCRSARLRTSIFRMPTPCSRMSRMPCIMQELRLHHHLPRRPLETMEEEDMVVIMHTFPRQLVLVVAVSDICLPM